MAHLNLSLYRKLDPSVLSSEAKAWFLANEGSFEYVQDDVPRDAAWTAEVMFATVGFVIRDAEGETLAEFDNLTDARRAIDGATVDFKLNIPKPASNAGTVVNVTKSDVR